MDTTTSDRRQTEPKIPCEKVPNAMMQPTSDSGVMGASSAGGRMPGEAMPGAVMGGPSATGKMPGEVMPGPAMGGVTTGKMPGEGMQGAAMGS